MADTEPSRDDGGGGGGGSQEVAAVPHARTVIYCGVCSLPPEYCEFGGTVKLCEEWLKKHHPETHERLYSDEAISANLSSLSLEAQKRAERDASKKAAKAEARAQALQHHRQTAKVQIKRVERNKRKHVTVVTGLEAHGLDLKKVAKEFGKKFATGSSVTKSSSYAPGGGSGGGSGSGDGAGSGAGGGGLGEEIVVQGDVGEEIYDWIVEKYGEVVPEDNIEVVEDKKR